jgi:iron complex outermembrane receptor protein
MYFKQKHLSIAVAASCLSVLTPNLAMAQSNMLEEIVVTARKTSESLQSTPVAVSALTENMLMEAQVSNLGDLRKTAPSLSIMEGGTGSSALVFIAIRGNAQTAPNAAADAAVGTYVDGVYFARPTGGNVDMFDVQRAEVLRGPQGTLFGRNTTGGAISIVTNQPTGEFEGYMKAEAGNFGHKRVEAVLNIPIMGDELATRFAVRYNERDGLGDYKGYTDPNGFVWDGLNKEAAAIDENTYARGKILWAPADKDIQVTLGGWYSNMSDSGQRTEVQAINSDFNLGPAGTLGGIMALAGFDPVNFINQQQPNDSYWNADNSTSNPVYNDAELQNPSSSNDTKGFYLDIDYSIGEYDIKSITSWHETISTGMVDLDGTPLSLLSFASVWEQDQISQEIQVSSSWGDVDWITGAYYFQEDSSGVSRSRSFGIFADLFAPGAPIDAVRQVGRGTNTTNDNTSKGIFFQANYSFSDALRGTAGIRYTWDGRDIVRMPNNAEVSAFRPNALDNCTIPEANRDNPNVCAQTEKADFEYPAWVLSLDYQLNDDMFLYAKTSGASMAGGWNVRGLALPSFEPEEVMDIELGFKADLFDSSLRFNTALFYMEADKQQRIVNGFINDQVTQFVRNASSTNTLGAEFELTWLAWDGMTITSNLSLLDSEYDDYDVEELLISGPNAGQLVTVDHSGENSPHAPEMTFQLGATQLIQTDMGEIALHADYFWVDDTWFQDNTVRQGESDIVMQQQREEQRHNFVGSYSLVNATATFTTTDEQWQVSVWGKNLADEEYYTGVSNFYSAFGSATKTWGSPRTFGASVKFTF